MATQNNPGTTLQLVSFLLDKEIFALDVMRIQGVERVSEVTSIPRMPEFMEGVINLRGEIIPIVDLRKRLGLPAEEHTKETRVMLVELKDTVVGLIVDKVFEVFQLDSSHVGQVPRLTRRAAVDNRFVEGVADLRDKLIIILDIEKVFTDEEMDEISRKT